MISVDEATVEVEASWLVYADRDMYDLGHRRVACRGWSKSRHTRVVLWHQHTWSSGES